MNDLARTLTFTTLLAASSLAMAVPTLQLGLHNGYYDSSEGIESVVTTSDYFQLHAYATPNAEFTIDDILNESYYISLSVIAEDGGVAKDAEGATHFSATDISDLNYGINPLDSVLHEQGLLEHDVFETYYAEHEFKWSELGQRVGLVDVTDYPGGITYGSEMLYKNMNVFLHRLVDGSYLSLNEDYEIRFDLYSSTLRDAAFSGDFSKVTKHDYAPRTHNAQTVPVTEPASWPLAALVLMGVCAIRRKTERL